MFTGSLCWCAFCNALWGGRSAWNVSDTYCTQNVCLLKTDKKIRIKRIYTAKQHICILCMCIFGGCIPVCVLACRWSSSLRVNRFPQKTQLHTKGLSPVCSRTCARSRDVFRKVFSQPAMWQMCFLFPTSPGLLQIKAKYKVPQLVIPFIKAIHYKMVIRGVPLRNSIIVKSASQLYPKGNKPTWNISSWTSFIVWI